MTIRQQRASWRLVVQLLYAARVRQTAYDWSIDLHEFTTDLHDRTWCMVTLTDIIAHSHTLDNTLQTHLDRPLSKLTPLEYAVLKFGTFQLTYGTLPAPIVLNETIELAKHFGSENGHRYVNVILQRLKRVDCK
jgi:transcription antitermination protein NusB